MLKEGVGCWGRSGWGLLVKNKSKVIINKYLPSARTVPCLAQYCQRQAQSHLGRPKEKITCPPSTPLYGFGDQVTKGPRAQFLTLGLPASSRRYINTHSCFLLSDTLEEVTTEWSFTRWVRMAHGVRQSNIHMVCGGPRIVSTVYDRGGSIHMVCDGESIA